MCRRFSSCSAEKCMSIAHQWSIIWWSWEKMFTSNVLSVKWSTVCEHCAVDCTSEGGGVTAGRHQSFSVAQLIEAVALTVWVNCDRPPTELIISWSGDVDRRPMMMIGSLLCHSGPSLVQYTPSAGPTPPCLAFLAGDSSENWSNWVWGRANWNVYLHFLIDDRSRYCKVKQNMAHTMHDYARPIWRNGKLCYIIYTL